MSRPPSNNAAHRPPSTTTAPGARRQCKPHAAARSQSAEVRARSLMDDYEPSLRQCLVVRPAQGSCGFHLSRTQWDPYPWVSEVEAGSPADKAGLVVGDCVLEVNGQDVLGLRIGVVALRVYAKGDQVRLLVWNSGVEYNAAIWVSWVFWK